MMFSWRVWRRQGAVLLALLLALLLLPLVAACNGAIVPAGDMSTSQAVIDLGNMLVQMREENADLQAQIDSLRAVTAYQDTIVRQLAGAAGLPMRPKAPGMF